MRDDSEAAVSLKSRDRPHFPARLSFVLRCSRKCSNNKQRKSRQTEACLWPPAAAAAAAAAAAVDDDNLVCFWCRRLTACRSL